jgi:hypothetical protein
MALVVPVIGIFQIFSRSDTQRKGRWGEFTTQSDLGSRTNISDRQDSDIADEKLQPGLSLFFGNIFAWGWGSAVKATTNCTKLQTQQSLVRIRLPSVS